MSQTETHAQPHKRAKLRLNKKIIILSVVLGIVLATAVFLGRGWIRGPLLHGYAELVYLKKIDRAFEADFKNAGPKLEELGLTFNDRYTGYLNEDRACHEPMYELFGVDIHCYRMNFNDNDTPELNDAYRERWQQESPSLEKFLLADGWTKTWNANQPIDELLARDDRGQSVGVNYAKVHGNKVSCLLSIWYNGSGTPEQREFNATKSCSRNIKFFGGY